MIGDHPDITPMYIPSLKAIIASDVVFNGIHLYMGHHLTKEARKGWIDAIDYLISLEPEIVVAGHKPASASDTPESLQYCRDYLVAFEGILEQSNTGDELVTALQKRFPSVRDMMNGFVLSRYRTLFDQIRKN
jgi:hypothetical protein